MYILPIEDDAAAVVATGSIAVAGPATQSGTLNVYVGGFRVRSLVSSGDTAIAIATALADAITATEGIEAVAIAAAGDATLTSIGKGEVFNGIDLRTNYLGAAGGEYDVPGVTLTITPMAGGTGNPGIAGALANLSDQPFDFIITPYTDTSNLDALKGFLADDVGRWSREQTTDGGAFAAFRGRSASARPSAIRATISICRLRRSTIVPIRRGYGRPRWEPRRRRACASIPAFRCSISTRR